MDSEMLADMLDTIQERNYNIDSVSVIRNGYMVADAYIHPFSPDSRHIIHSCTKSIISALIGIAIEEGYIESVEQPVLDFFPGRTVANLDANKKAMTLERLLTMTSALNCRDSYLCTAGAASIRWNRARIGSSLCLICPWPKRQGPDSNTATELRFSSQRSYRKRPV